MGKAFILYLKEKGTHQKLSVHDTPQHTGVAERFNRTAVEKVWAMLHASSLLRFLWGEVMNHIVWIMNRTATRALENKTPFEATMGSKPDLTGLREWGEKVWVRTEKGTKLGGCVKEGCWVGFDGNSKGSRIFWPDSRTISVK
jgi:hypothetical protein